jgi:hypothetical protein
VALENENRNRFDVVGAELNFAPASLPRSRTGNKIPACLHETFISSASLFYLGFSTGYKNPGGYYEIAF